MYAELKCYDCFQWILNETECDNCVKSCQNPSKNSTEIYAKPTKACYFEYFVGTVVTPSSPYHGQTC